MKLARVATFVHKWLALLVAIQVVFWVASGLFFTLYPIEEVRSEHLIRETRAQALNTADFGALAQIRGPAGEAPTKLTLEQRATGQVVVAEFANEPPTLFDATTMRQLSPLGPDAAAAIASTHVTLAEAPTAITRITQGSPEYRGALPAYRVQFEEDGLAVYVAEQTGAVTARRSDLWRFYDFLWALHIMDWENHEDFNHPLLIAAAALTLISIIAGIVLLPFRIRLGRRPTRGDAHVA